MSKQCLSFCIFFFSKGKGYRRLRKKKYLEKKKLATEEKLEEYKYCE